jgi:hypothetical protein
MLVAMMFRSNARIEGEDEDVHGTLSFCLAQNDSVLAPIQRRQHHERHAVRVFL